MSDFDSAFWARFLQGFSRALFPMLVLGGLVVYWRYGWSGSAFLTMLAIVFGICLIAGICVDLVLEGIVSIGEGMFGKRSVRSKREQLAGEVERIKYFQREKDFRAALRAAEEVLEKIPDFTEVLALKILILREGYGRTAEAWRLLRKMMGEIPKDDPVYQWAVDYYAKMLPEMQNEPNGTHRKK